MLAEALAAFCKREREKNHGLRKDKAHKGYMYATTLVKHTNVFLRLKIPLILLDINFTSTLLLALYVASHSVSGIRKLED